MMASAGRVTEKSATLQQQQLKCPRCDSSNTKFCYYNNYSLSQPRHFCKACKRYWTRGGTLRNVPVGGGCRKNKRSIKRHQTTTTPQPSSSATTTTSSAPSMDNPNPNLDHLPSSTPLFYGLLPANPSSFPRFDTTRVSNVVSGYDNLLQQPHMNSLGLGFSSSSSSSDQLVAHNSSNSLLSSYPTSMFGVSDSNSNTTSPSMASLLASSLQQQQRFMGFASYEDGSMVKDVKMEGIQNRVDWSNGNNTNGFHNHDNNGQIIGAVGSSDPNSLLWNTPSGGGGGGWLDPTTNIGSSVPSLI